MDRMKDLRMKATLAGLEQPGQRNAWFSNDPLIEQDREISLDDIKEGIVGAFTEMYASMKKAEEKERRRKEKEAERLEQEERRLAKEELRAQTSKRR